MNPRPVLFLAAGLLVATALGAEESALQNERAELQTMWEVLWHQTGQPTEVAKWDQPIAVHITGVHASKHHDEIMQALGEVSAAAGVPLVEVPRIQDARKSANVFVEITTDRALEDKEPCVTYMDLNPDNTIRGVLVRMRDHEVGRCRYHEFMHTMGLRGHPRGDTVLSYFRHQTAPLTSLDKMMLRAWYSPEMQPGMGPLAALAVLSEESVCASAGDREAALRVREQFYAAALVFSKAYVDGSGDVPAIVRQSGKATSAGATLGRLEMRSFLQASAPSAVSYKLQCKSPVSQ